MFLTVESNTQAQTSPINYCSITTKTSPLGGTPNAFLVALAKTSAKFTLPYSNNVGSPKDLAKHTVDAAIQKTRNVISMEIGLDKRDFATPVLYMRAKDGIINVKKTTQRVVSTNDKN